MLFAMVSTVDRGNFVLDRWPHEKTYPVINSKLQSTQFVDTVIGHFSYFGFYPKKAALRTNLFSFSETCLLQTFIANEKRLENVLGIEEECVLASRGLFLVDQGQHLTPSSNNSIQNNYYTFEDSEDVKRSRVNSISLIWNAKSFEEVDTIKHRISFLLGVLQRKEASKNYLSEQIAKIIEAKYKCEHRIREECANFQNKNSSASQLEIYRFIDKCYEIGRSLTKDIEIFAEFEKFAECILNGEQYVVTPDPEPWEGSMGSKYKIPTLEEQSERKKEQTCHKTLLLIKKRLESLPPVLFDSRVQLIAEKINANEHKSLKQIITGDRQLTTAGTLKTVNFFVKNDFGVIVYPFDKSVFMNTYVLDRIPNWKTIKKFNNKIFTGSNLMKQLLKYSQIKHIKNLTREDKYIIVQKLVSQLSIYIYRFGPNEESSENQSDVEDQEYAQRSLLGEYANKPFDINHIAVRQDSLSTVQIFKILHTIHQKQTSNEHICQNAQWGFYFVEK